MTVENEVRRIADGVADRVREAVTRELHAAFGGSRSSPERGAVSDGAVGVGGVLPSIRRMDEARTLTSVLDVLAEGQGSETARTAVYLVVDGQMRLWKRSGSGWEKTEAPPRGLTLPVAETGLVDGEGNGFAAPIRVGNEVVALVYSDDRLAANVLEADAREAAMVRLELLTRHAGRTLEALTAMRTAQLLAANPDAARAAKMPAVQVSAAHNQTPERSGQTAAEDVEAARRYARLLVSEIKLYHEPAVAAGLRERDLASRLGGEIARARALYHERVPQLPEAEAVFHAELVRTLAGGDASLFSADR
jgi:hypothetical protein